ncbi:MAG TPA: hypothetical protein VKP60_19230 [Magnetospirillaceae bacterium]|nr:hypothetical protein [Magnetospirillaceae bacterium]
MLFLVEYDRRRGQLVSLQTYPESQREKAGEARLAKELNLQREGVEREVVMLDAASEEALRKTHRRYFETVQTLARAS